MSESLFPTFLESGPILVHVALSLGLGVHLDTVFAFSIFRVRVNGDLETTGRAIVRNQIEFELSGVLLLNAICNRDGILGVASAAAVVNHNVVGSCVTAFRLS